VSDHVGRERERRILDVLIALRDGEVTTYGDVADVAGYPKQSRLVGRILATTDVEVPWWRVVTASGRIVSGHPDEQRLLLRAEGVSVVDDRVRDAPTGRFSRSSARSARPSRRSDP
jgi:methylated-DNA-protein-cysteine methyltransferase-like protein